MDEFVQNKLTEWGLSEWIDHFREQGIDEDNIYDLDEQDIVALMPRVGPRSTFRKKLRLLKEGENTKDQETLDSSAQCQQEHEEAVGFPQVYPSTSDTREIQSGKRISDHQLDSSNCPSPSRKRRRDDIDQSFEEGIILSDVKNIMRCVHERIPKEDNKLNKFIKDKIRDLETDKRELVGVFGKTGAGKSSLINAVIGEKNLLPSGSFSACTSVMIKVEANMQSKKYEAHIDFITKEEWKDELWSLLNFLGDNADQETNDEDYYDTVEKLSALYGEEWKNKTPEDLMDRKYFKEIPEFLSSERKTLTCESAEELSAKFVKYTKSGSKDGEGKEVKRWYWPLVKCVTVRVPDNGLLQHVTLVDLPGNGDRNKSRDKMWKEVVGSCSAVWIVTEINRAASESEAWEILKSASSLMGNGGECQQIHFICTKSDDIEDSDELPLATVRARIYKRNMQAKEEMSKEFSKRHKVKKHFSEGCFEVFTVSSKEFLKKKPRLTRDDTEIPKLQEFLQNLNDCHSETSNYVSGAYGILSLIQGSRCTEVAGEKTDVCTDLEENIRLELEKVRKPLDETYETFEKCLSEGVENAKKSYENVLQSFLNSHKRSGRGFHKILKSLVKNYGTYKPKKGKQMNLNMKLSSFLTDSIDEEFQKTFPNDGKLGPFNGAISTFSLHTEKLIEKYKSVELQLIFLKTEEQKMMSKLNKTIRERKKTVYSCLTTTVEEIMQECYKKAATFTGEGSLNNMRETIKKHVYDSKDTMFEQAKNEMLSQLRDLKEEILRTLKGTLQKSVDLSLKTDGVLIPDVKVELAEVKKYKDQLVDTLMKNDEFVALAPGPSAALSP